MDMLIQFAHNIMLESRSNNAINFNAKDVIR